MQDKGFRQELVEHALRGWLAGAERLIVLGVGNELRGDDAAGLLVARALKRFNGERFEAVECGATLSGRSLRTCLSWMLFQTGAG